MARFGKVLTAMVTPFREDGSLDLDTAASLAQWLSDNGSDGLVIAGTTGEAPTLTHDEQIDLIGAVVAAVDVPVVAGAGSNDTAAAVELTERAQEAGADGVLSVAPYYNRPSAGRLGQALCHGGPRRPTFRCSSTTFPVAPGARWTPPRCWTLAHGVANIVGSQGCRRRPRRNRRPHRPGAR